jgi:uncharacterized protein GlcG (DUF336 family)
MVDTTFDRVSISSDAASAVISAARAQSESMGLRMTIAVVDDVGMLKGLLRMDRASLLSLDSAQNKAYTAALMKMGTGDYFDFIQGDPVLLTGMPPWPRLMPIAGGLPLKVGDVVVGAIGVGGGHYDQDLEVAKAGVEAFSQ